MSTPTDATPQAGEEVAQMVERLNRCAEAQEAGYLDSAAIPSLLREAAIALAAAVRRAEEAERLLRTADGWLGHWPEHDNKCPSCGVRSRPCMEGCYVAKDQKERHQYLDALAAQKEGA